MTNKISMTVILLILTLNLHGQEIFGTHITNAPGVRFREAPRLDAAVISSLPEGTELIPLERASGTIEIGQWTGNWVKIRTREDEGYLFSPFISYNPATPSGMVQFGLIHQGDFGIIYNQYHSSREYNRANSYAPGFMHSQEYDLIPGYFKNHPNWEGIRIYVEDQRFHFSDELPWGERDGAGYIFAGPQLPERIELQPDIRCRLNYQGEGHAQSYADLQGERSAKWQIIEADFLPSIEEFMEQRAIEAGPELYPVSLHVQGVTLWSDQFFHLTTVWLSPPEEGKFHEESYIEEGIEPYAMIWDGFYRVHNGEFIYLGGLSSRQAEVFSFNPFFGFASDGVHKIFDADGDGFPEFWMIHYAYESGDFSWVFTGEESIERSTPFGFEGM